MLAKDFVERSGIQVLEGFSSVAEAFSYLALRKIKVIEVNLNNPYYLAQLAASKERREIAKVALEEGITWLAHLPEGIGFLGVEEEVFARYLAWLIQLQKKAGEAGCKALTLHIGSAPYFAYSGTKRQGTDLFREYHETNLLLRIKRAANLLRKGPPVAYENVGGFRLEFVRDILARVDGITYTMDIGHLQAADPQTMQGQWKFFQEHASAIRVVHVHTNDGEWDKHLPMRDPEALEPYISFAKNLKAYLIIEVRPLEAALASLSALTGIKR